eukprot:319456-Prymnesium_polylepis.1
MRVRPHFGLAPACNPQVTTCPVITARLAEHGWVRRASSAIVRRYIYVGFPYMRGLAYASRPVWLQGKGPSPPGFLPALS